MLTVAESKDFDWENIPLLDCLYGNSLDTYFTLKLFKRFKETLEENGSLQLYETLFSKIIPIFAVVEYNGIEVDLYQLDNLEKSLGSAVVDLEDEIYTTPYVEKSDSLSSTEDQVEIFYTREGGLGLYPPKFTDNNSPSTDKATLAALLDLIDNELEKRL